METRIADLGGPVHYADWGGDGPPMVLVHGLGGSHLNWMSLAPLLRDRHRVLAPDLPGFGLSDPAGRSAGVEANSRVLDRFITEVAGGPAIVAGNSMGGLVSLLAAADHPEHVSRLILVDAALPRPLSARPDGRVLLIFGVYTVPRLGEWYLRRRAQRLGPKGLVRETLRLCCADPSRVDREAVAAHIDLAERRQGLPWGAAAFLEAARSIIRMQVPPTRTVAVIDRVRVPTLMLQGDRDRLVSLQAAESTAQRRPDWRLEVFEDVGHIPQLEVPERTAEAMTAWLTSLETGSAKRGRGGRAVAAQR